MGNMQTPVKRQMTLKMKYCKNDQVKLSLQTINAKNAKTLRYQWTRSLLVK